MRARGPRLVGIMMLVLIPAVWLFWSFRPGRVVVSTPTPTAPATMPVAAATDTPSPTATPTL